MKSVINLIAVLLLSIVSPALARPSHGISQRQYTDRLVFCHFMVRLLTSNLGVFNTSKAIPGLIED